MPRSVMPASGRFARVPRAEIPRSTFDRSHGYKTTFDAGYLVPVFLDEVLPGDTANLRMHAFARMATPLKPVMDNMFLESFFFFVPYRLLWSNWERFCGAQDDPGDSTDFNVPRIADGLMVNEGKLADYFGLPLGAVTGVTERRISALPFRAYRKIYNDWFRDENLQDTVDFPLDDGPDDNAESGFDTALFRRGKRHDYFTSCLPWPQKDTLGAQVAPVVGLGLGVGQNPTFQNSGATVTGAGLIATTTASTTDLGADSPVGDWTAGEALFWDDPALSIDINSLRQAFQLQRMAERDARGGTRYIEIILSHFGVTSPDARLQRSEYLGGGSSPVNISPVANTSGTATENQGDLAGFGTVNVNGHGFVKSFTEHGILMGLVSVRADLTYQQGIERFWSRVTREDFYWPVLSQIGEQAVLQQEIFVEGNADDALVFGYQERYAEYRYKPSRVTNLFSSLAAAPLDMWHLAQEFATPPTLNSVFLIENPPLDRVIAVPTEPHFLFDSYFQYRHARPMPVYGVPGLIDHF